MLEWIDVLVSFWEGIMNVLFSMQFEVGASTTSYGAMIIVGLIIGFVISVFWKGAKT